jgi:hypothetical protein
MSVLARAEISNHGGSAVVEMEPMLQGFPEECQFLGHAGTFS